MHGWVFLVIHLTFTLHHMAVLIDTLLPFATVGKYRVCQPRLLKEANCGGFSRFIYYGS